MIGLELVAILATTGVSASLGRLRRIWLTLACTSLKATSTFLFRSKVIATIDTPGDEVELMCWMPGVLLTAVSMILVMLESTTSGLAPFSVVVMETMGNSI